MKDVDYMWGKVNVSKGESQAPKYYTKLQKLTNTVHFVAQLEAADKDQKIVKILVSGEGFKTKAEVDYNGEIDASMKDYIGYLTIVPENMTVGADGKTPDIYFKTFQTDIHVASTLTIQILLENGKTYKKTYGRTKNSETAVKFYTDELYPYGHMLHFNNITRSVTSTPTSSATVSQQLSTDTTATTTPAQKTHHIRDGLSHG